MIRLKKLPYIMVMALFTTIVSCTIADTIRPSAEGDIAANISTSDIKMPPNIAPKRVRSF